ncbi:hypothetical protein QJS10_CPB11g01713 [Acorus calamus]|uniref:Uncharacterized protein n=1 Tax=Acorus calamus TaxID=4465 RepID=A0AAV9DVQ4_ACOCL|nr:hypothetical protein QJS10_CPB11g01713 [Acorus calamus]
MAAPRQGIGTEVTILKHGGIVESNAANHEAWSITYSVSKSQVMKIMLPAALRSIWLSRNKCLFKVHHFYTENLWEDILHSMSEF